MHVSERLIQYLKNEKNMYSLNDILLVDACSWYCCLWSKYM